MKSKWIHMVLLLALLLVLVPLGSVRAGEPLESPAIGIGWETFADHEWRYTTRYPRDWTVRVVFTNGEDRPLHVIRKRVRFSGPNHAEINVDVWQKPVDMDLMEWLDENRRRMLELGEVQIPSTTNAVIDGQASVVLTQVGDCTSFPLLYSYIPAKDRMFDVSYYAADGGDALDIYRQMLLSFSGGAEYVDSEPGPYVPELSYLLASIIKTQGWEECYWAYETPASAWCCGYRSECTYHKCSLERETYKQRGNCVWWAARQRPDVGNVVLVHAGQWAEEAKAAGFPVDGTPEVGDVFCNNVNHVAYVTGVHPTTVDVTEMGWCRPLPCRVVSVNYPITGISFIHRKNNDREPPQTSIASGPSGCVGTDGATFGWTGSDNQTPTSNLEYRCRLDGYSDWSDWTDNTSKTYDNLPDGSYTFRVKAKDEAGNEDPSPATRSFQVDTRVPSNPTSVQSNCGAQNNLWQSVCNEPQFTWSGASDQGCAGIQEYEYRWQTESGTLIESGTTSAASFNPQNPVSEGVYKLRLRTKDTLGHWSGWSDAFVLRYDSTAPTVTLQINGGAETTNQTNVLLNLSASDTGSSVASVRISNNNLIWSDWQPYADPLPWTLPALDRHTHTVYVQVRDHAGNVSNVASDTIYLDLYPPMPHSANYRICQDVIDVGGSAGTASASYSLVSTIGQPWATGAMANTSSGFSERAGFLASITGCLPISHPVTSFYTVTNWVIASGGNLRGSNSYRLGDTAGQPAASGATAFTSANYRLSSGFWAQITGTVPPTPTVTPPTPTLTPTVTPTPTPTPTPQPGGFGVSINEGDLYTNDPNVAVRVWAPNVTHMRLSNDGGYSDEGWWTYQVTTTWTISTYGEYVMPRYVYAWFRDAQSSVYGSYFDDIIYDPVAPEGQISILGGETSTVTLWLEAWDDNSGVVEVRVGESPTLEGASWQPYTSTLEWTLTGDVVYAQFRDSAGNPSIIYSSGGSHIYTEKIYLPLVLRNH